MKELSSNAAARRLAAVALASILALTACSSSNGNGSQTPTPTSTSTSDILNRQLPAGVTAEGVLLAAILLRAGDIDQAVSQGIVTPAEVDLAANAIKEGNLDLWRQRAEAESK